MTRHNPEELLISAVLRSGELGITAGKGITPNVFQMYEDEWDFIESYNRKHLIIPTKTVFKQRFPQFIIIKTDEVSHWCDLVLEEFHRNLLMVQIEDSLDDLDGGDIGRAIENLSATMTGIQTNLMAGTTNDALTEYSSVLEEVKTRFDRREEYGKSGISSGFPSVDSLTGGFQPGWLVVVSARLGQGKTWTMLKMAWSAVKEGATVLFCSLEQSSGQITMRLHGMASSELWDTTFGPSELQKGDASIDLAEYEMFLEELPTLVPGQLAVTDSRRGRVSPAGVGALIELHSPSIVFIDYLTLLEQKGDGDYRSVGQLTADLKMLAEKYQVTIVVGAQINRGGVGKEPPKVENLASSDSIGQDADLVVTMAKQSDEVLKMRMAKNRHGADGHLWFCEFRPGKGIYREITGDKAEKIINENYEDD